MVQHLNLSDAKFVKNTKLNAEYGNKKRISLNGFVADVLSEIADNLNKKFTQGIIAYEYLLMTRDDITDEIDELEQMVDTQLRELDIDPTTINDIRYSDQLDLREQTDNNKRRNIWIANDVNIDWDTYNKKVEQAVVDGYNSIFTDRFERIEVKRDLINIVSTGTTKRKHSKKAKQIYNGYDGFDIPLSLEAKFSKDIETSSDYIEIADELKSWSDRFRMLNNLLQNKQLSFNSVEEMLCDAHGFEDMTWVRNKIRKYARENPEHKYLIENDEYAFAPDTIEVDEEVSKGNWIGLYSTSNLTREEILYKLAESCDGSVPKPSVKKIWNTEFDDNLVEFVRDCEHLAYASKDKLIYTIDAFPENYI